MWFFFVCVHWLHCARCFIILLSFDSHACFQDRPCCLCHHFFSLIINFDARLEIVFCNSCWVQLKISPEWFDQFFFSSSYSVSKPMPCEVAFHQFEHWLMAMIVETQQVLIEAAVPELVWLFFTSTSLGRPGKQHSCKQYAAANMQWHWYTLAKPFLGLEVLSIPVCHWYSKVPMLWSQG